MNPFLSKILDHAVQQLPITQEQALELSTHFQPLLLDIFAVSRLAAAKPSPFTCGIINAKSGKCQEDCSFCAQSAHHMCNTPHYPLVPTQTLLEKAETLAKAGVNYMGIVTSGTSPSNKDFEQLCKAAQTIIQETGIKLCASFGLITKEQALSLRQAGFTSYHHNLETAQSYFHTVCTTHTYRLRIETIENAKKAGLRVCAGGIFGLGEAWEQRIELSATLQKLDVDSIPVNFLIPVKGTKLENQSKLQINEALAIIALIRLMHPKRDIVVCGGRNIILQEWDNFVFSAGANGLMVGDYLTTKGAGLERDMDMIKILGVL